VKQGVGRGCTFGSTKRAKSFVASKSILGLSENHPVFQAENAARMEVCGKQDQLGEMQAYFMVSPKNIKRGFAAEVIAAEFLKRIAANQCPRSQIEKNRLICPAPYYSKAVVFQPASKVAVKVAAEGVVP
jgi:hypothetical protein